MPEDSKQSDNTYIDLKSYYGNDKFALWIDLRSTQDNQLHGTGKIQMSDKNDITLAIQKREKETTRMPDTSCMLILCQTQELISRTKN